MTHFTPNQLKIAALRQTLRARYGLYGARSRRDGNYRYGIWVLAHCERYGSRF